MGLEREENIVDMHIYFVRQFLPRRKSYVIDFQLTIGSFSAVSE